LTEKCILRHFSAHPKNPASQPARYEAFTRSAKTDCLYDNDTFAFDPGFARFPCNLLKINRIALKSTRFAPRQNGVTYNKMPFAEPEKRGFLPAFPAACARPSFSVGAPLLSAVLDLNRRIRADFKYARPSGGLPWTRAQPANR
jgi:hypothetical protein